MDGEQLAALLADRFQRIFPAGVSVEAHAGTLEYSMPGRRGFFGGRLICQVGEHFQLLAGQRSEDDRALDAAVQALDDLQDYVDEETTEPWPGDRRVPPVGGEVWEGHILLFFGDAKSPILSCEPIPLS